MNIFDKIALRGIDETLTLGNPLVPGSGPFLARMTNMATLTSGRGFKAPGARREASAHRGKQRRHMREIYLRNLKAEATFRQSKAGKRGWSTKRINSAIERLQHLK